VLSFLLQAVAISLSGVMAPGPMTAVTLAAGARSRHAGALVALGHAVVEMPLILLLAAGIGEFLKSPAARLGIGLAGGAVLILFGVQLLVGLRGGSPPAAAEPHRHPLLTGIVLTGANPYFLVWWATVGLALATQALQWGALALVAFAVVHWLCDLVWLEILSLLGFKGSAAFGPRAQRAVSAACALVLLGFGAKFLYDAAAGVYRDRPAAVARSPLPRAAAARSVVVGWVEPERAPPKSADAVITLSPPMSIPRRRNSRAFF